MSVFILIKEKESKGATPMCRKLLAAQCKVQSEFGERQRCIETTRRRKWRTCVYRVHFSSRHRQSNLVLYKYALVHFEGSLVKLVPYISVTETREQSSERVKIWDTILSDYLHFSADE